jgi:hypothetical protein
MNLIGVQFMKKSVSIFFLFICFGYITQVRASLNLDREVSQKFIKLFHDDKESRDEIIKGVEQAHKIIEEEAIAPNDYRDEYGFSQLGGKYIFVDAIRNFPENDGPTQQQLDAAKKDPKHGNRPVVLAAQMTTDRLFLIPGLKEKIVETAIEKRMSSNRAVATRVASASKIVPALIERDYKKLSDTADAVALLTDQLLTDQEEEFQQAELLACGDEVSYLHTAHARDEDMMMFRQPYNRPAQAAQAQAASSRSDTKFDFFLHKCTELFYEIIIDTPTQKVTMHIDDADLRNLASKINSVISSANSDTSSPSSANTYDITMNTSTGKNTLTFDYANLKCFANKIASFVGQAVANKAQGALPAQAKAATVAVGALPIAAPGAFLSYGRRPGLSAEEITERELQEERKEAERRNEQRKKEQRPKELEKQVVSVPVGVLPIAAPGAFLSYGRRPGLSAEEIAERELQEKLKEERKEAERRNEQRKKEQRPNELEKQVVSVPVGVLPIAAPGAFLSYGRRPGLSAEEITERELQEKLKEERKEAERRNEQRKKEQRPNALEKQVVPVPVINAQAQKDLDVAAAMLKVQQRLAQLQSDSQNEAARNVAALREQQAQMQAAHSARVNDLLRDVIAEHLALADRLADSYSGGGSSGSDAARSSHDGDHGDPGDRDRHSGGSSYSRGSSSKHGNSSSGGSICLSSSCRDCHLGSRDSGGGSEHNSGIGDR